MLGTLLLGPIGMAVGGVLGEIIRSSFHLHSETNFHLVFLAFIAADTGVSNESVMKFWDIFFSRRQGKGTEGACGSVQKYAEIPSRDEQGRETLVSDSCGRSGW